LEVLADSDGIVAALAIDQRNALRSLFARSERRSGMCLERKRSSSFDKRARKNKNTPQKEYARVRFTPLDWRRHRGLADTGGHKLSPDDNLAAYPASFINWRILSLLSWH
jgi:hypothetical protein